MGSTTPPEVSGSTTLAADPLSSYINGPCTHLTSFTSTTSHRCSIEVSTGKFGGQDQQLFMFLEIFWAQFGIVLLKRANYYYSEVLYVVCNHA